MIISDDEDDFTPPTPRQQAGTMIVNTERTFTSDKVNHTSGKMTTTNANPFAAQDEVSNLQSMMNDM